MAKYFLVGFSVIVIAAITYLVNVCPCERVPGLWLTGEEVSTPVDDWSFANDVPLCQVEVRSWRPHSINLNCMSSATELFVSCSNCAGKSWSNTAVNHPNGKIRIGDQLYPVEFQRIVDAQTLDKAWLARAQKLNREVSARPDHWWSFQLTSPAS